MAEIELTASASIPAPPERVWELVSDTARYAEWVEGTDEVTRTDGPAAPGSTYDEVNPIAGPWKARSRWTVIEFDPPRRQVHRGEGLPLTAEFLVVIELTAVGGATELTLTLRGRSSGGPLGAAQFRLLRGQVERDNRKSVQSFAELAARELRDA